MSGIRIESQVSVVKATKDSSIAQWGQVKELVNKFNKETVRVATVGELTGTYAAGVLTLDTPVTEIDGITLSENDRVLVKDQIDATQNGIYFVDATGDTLTRTDDFNEGTVIMNNTGVAVAEGTTNADTRWIVVSDGVLTVGTSSIIFTKDVGDNGIKKAHGDFVGDGVTKEFAVVHNFNLTDTKAYQITVRGINSADTEGVKDIIVNHSPTVSAEANSVTISFDNAPLATEKFDVYLLALE